MAERDDLLRAVQAARTGPDLAAAVMALDQHDRHRTASLQQSRELDLSAADVRRTLDPLPAFERHTAATDWLEDYQAPTDYRTAMIAEASQWYRSIPPGLTADPDEFQEQALGRAYTAAGKYGQLALEARREFMQFVGYLTRSGASGLPQIQQEEDPKDNPAPTPLPTEVFDNFAPEKNEFNDAIEGDNHDSQISSEQAPGIQTLEQQQGGGSGFGSGPERADVHSTSMDTADGYSEVPPGQPGQIPANVAGPAPSAPSTPNPIAGQNMDEGSEKRQTVAAYTPPDHEGFRWRLTAARDGEEPVPYHEKCGALHWPDEACGHGQAHTASMAVGYVMNAEDWYRRARFQDQGAAEGTAVLRAVGTDMSKVAQHHNTLIGSFKMAARTEDEVAWLRGYLAQIRPVLAGGGLQCEGCGSTLKPGKAGKCKGCKTAARRGLDFQIAAEAALVREGIDYQAGLPPMTVHDMRIHLWKTHGLSARSLAAQERAHSGSVDELMTHLTKIHRKDHGAVGAMDHPHGAIDRSIVGQQPSHGIKPGKVKDKDKLPSKLTQPDEQMGARASLAKDAAGDSVPLRICPNCGSTYCKHWQGRDKPYDLPGEPYGTGEKSGSLAKGAPFAGYKDFAACVAANQDKDSPDAYCGKIKHQVEGMLGAGQDLPAVSEPGGQGSGPTGPFAERMRVMSSNGGPVSAAQPGGQTASHRSGGGSGRGSAGIAPGVSAPQELASQAQGHRVAGRQVPGVRDGQSDRPLDQPSRGPGGWIEGQRAEAVAQHYFGQEAAQRVRSALSELPASVGVPAGFAHTAHLGRVLASRGVPDDVIAAIEVDAFLHQGASSLPQIQEHTDSHDNPDPGGDQLNQAVMFPLNPGWVSGQADDDQDKASSKQAARSSMTPSSSAVKMFGRMDAMEGKRPHHKSKYPFSDKAHGQYMRGWNETRGTIDGTLGKDPIGKDDYAEWSGRPDLHKHYMGVYGQAKAGHELDVTSRIPSERAWSNEPGHMGSLRRQADTLTRPHQSTDDDHPPFNSPATTPDPYSSNEGGGDFAAGMKEGREDAANGEKPTFSDNSSRVSPYVQGYAQGYFGGQPAAGAQDVPHSMGGDSGQAMNAGQAGTQWQVAQASLKRTAACGMCGCTSHLGEPCNTAGCRCQHQKGEEGGGPGRHPRTIGHEPDPDHPGYSRPKGGKQGQRHTAHDFTEDEREDAAHSLGPEHKLPVNSKQDLANAHRRAHQVEGIPESTVDSYLSRLDKEYGKTGLRVSAAFVTREAVAEPDFVKAYRFAARWADGMPLVRRGSAAFEAGLYAGIADRPSIQGAWLSAHSRQAARYPEMGERIESHASFSRKAAAGMPNRYRVSGTGYYLVRKAVPRKTAATSVDLITDGPGTSPDPMGSTPLNGPGQPPPMGGQEDPAASGGPPPYQTVEPAGHGPVAPDDVLGAPQGPVSESGPFTQTYSGRHPGNIDLAPVAPNLAGGAGYSNTDANQGNPGHMDPHKQQQAMAFRRTVQASLARRRAMQPA
jgi:hypothetical protein